MKIVRKETGRFAGVPERHAYDLKEINGPEYVALVSALDKAIEVYKGLGWTEAGDTLGETYIQMRQIHANMTDYGNHYRTFNGKKVLPYSELKK